MNKTFFSIFDWRKLIVFKQDAGEKWTSHLGILFIIINEIYYRGNRLSDKELNLVSDNLGIDKVELRCVIKNAINSRILRYHKFIYRINAMFKNEYTFDAQTFVDNVAVPVAIDCQEIRILLKEYVTYRKKIGKLPYFTPRHLSTTLHRLSTACVGNKKLVVSVIRDTIDNDRVKLIRPNRIYGKQNTEQHLQDSNTDIV